MNDITLGAIIAFLSAIVTLIVSQILGYFLSVRVEREKTKLKQLEDAKTFRLNSIKEMKKELIEVRLDLSKFYMDSSFSEESPGSRIPKHDLYNSYLRLLVLKSNLHTYSETKDLAKIIDELHEELWNFQKVVESEGNSNKIEELYKKLVGRIETLLTTTF